MTIIDVHNHVYPAEYVTAAQAGPGAYGVTFDNDGKPVLHSLGDHSNLVPGHRPGSFVLSL